MQLFSSKQGSQVVLIIAVLAGIVASAAAVTDCSWAIAPSDPNESWHYGPNWSPAFSYPNEPNGSNNVYVWNGGTSNYGQTASDHTVNYLNVSGDMANLYVGKLNHSSHGLTINSDLEVGSRYRGTYNLNFNNGNPCTLTVKGDSKIGAGSGGTGTMNINANTSSSVSSHYTSRLLIGHNGSTGKYYIYAGTDSGRAYVCVTGDAYVGYQPDMDGNNGIGLMDQTGGSVSINQGLYVGSNQKTSGTYYLRSGGSLSAQSIYVGCDQTPNPGTGLFHDYGGTISTTTPSGLKKAQAARR